MNLHFSQRAQKLTSSAIREILKITERPEVISFAGGLPSPATFPIQAMHEAVERVFADNPEGALQYGPTEGYGPLREWIAQRHNTTASRVMLTTGSQQALDLLAKVLIDPGSKVLVETPTYLGALQAFSLFEPQYVSVPSDEGGPIVSEMTDSACKDARFFYVLPNFQNPTGRRMDTARREALVKRAAELKLPLVEDDPYGELSYKGDHLVKLRELNPEGVVYLGSFSKILAPGLRLGYIIAPEELLFKLVQAKQAADLHTPSFTQRLAYEVLKTGLLETHIPKIRELYAAQCDAMLTALKEFMPDGVKWNRPEGGMFIWVTLPEGMDSMKLLEKAVAKNVAYVPGTSMYANQAPVNTLRLAFVTVPEARIRQGVQTLSELIREEIGLKAA